MAESDVWLLAQCVNPEKDVQIQEPKGKTIYITNSDDWVKRSWTKQTPDPGLDHYICYDLHLQFKQSWGKLVGKYGGTNISFSTVHFQIQFQSRLIKHDLEVYYTPSVSRLYYSCFPQVVQQFRPQHATSNAECLVFPHVLYTCSLLTR